jgi:hypothetical protein
LFSAFMNTGLKPLPILPLYAALKRRSSTGLSALSCMGRFYGQSDAREMIRVSRSRAG